MARLKKVAHILTIGSDKYSFRAPDIYGNFGSQFGVQKASNPDNTEYKGKLGNDDFAEGKVIKIKARGVQRNTDGAINKSRDFTFVVPFDKARSALANLESKQVSLPNNGGNWDITSARIPARRRFS